VVGAPARFTVETSAAGSGELEVVVLSPKGTPEKVFLAYHLICLDDRTQRRDSSFTVFSWCSQHSPPHTQNPRQQHYHNHHHRSHLRDRRTVYRSIYYIYSYIKLNYHTHHSVAR